MIVAFLREIHIDARESRVYIWVSTSCLMSIKLENVIQCGLRFTQNNMTTI